MFKEKIMQLLNTLSDGIPNSSIGTGFKVTYTWNEYDNSKWKPYQCSFHLHIEEVNRLSSYWEYYEKSGYAWNPKITEIKYDSDFCDGITYSSKTIAI
jgi:hypothetical protein